MRRTRMWLKFTPDKSQRMTCLWNTWGEIRPTTFAARSSSAWGLSSPGSTLKASSPWPKFPSGRAGPQILFVQEAVGQAVIRPPMQAAARHRQRPLQGKTRETSASRVPFVSACVHFRRRFAARPQLLRGMEPVFVRRSFGTAPGFPHRISQLGNVRVPEDREAVLIHLIPMRLPSVLVRLLRVLKSLPGEFLAALVILFLMRFRSTTMSVGGAIVQLCSSLMIFVMRSVVISCRHFKGSLFLPIWSGLPLRVCRLGPSTPALVPNERRPLGSPLFRYARQRYDGPVRQDRAVGRLAGVPRAWYFLQWKRRRLSFHVHDADQSLLDARARIT